MIESNICEEDNDQLNWETDSDSNDQYYRLKIDNVTNVKSQIKKILQMKSKKYKKLDSESEEKLNFVKQYMNSKIFPTLSLVKPKSGVSEIQEKDYDYENNKNTLDKIFLIGNEYNVIKNPEIGSCLIFEILSNKNSMPTNLNLVGVSNEYFNATTKIHLNHRIMKPLIVKPKLVNVKIQPTENTKSRNKSRSRSRKSGNILGKDIHGDNNEDFQVGDGISNRFVRDNLGSTPNNNNNLNLKLNSNLKQKTATKTRRKKKKQYIKNTTIINIKQIK